MVSSMATKNVQTFALILGSVLVMTVVWLSSFRLGVGNIELAWHVNFDRFVLAVAAGIAFAGSGALIGATSAHIRFHILGFTIVSTASSAILSGALWGLSWGVIVPSSAIVGTLTWVIASPVLQYKKNTNLWSAALLVGAFSLSVINFLLASSVGGTFGKLVYWLQGDLLEASDYSFLALVLSLALFTWTLISKSKEVPASLLLGLGVGVIGPIFFVACVVPFFVRSLIKCSGETRFLTSCAALGALFLVLADSIPRLLIGGYSPSLIIAIGLVSIPYLLYCQRNRLLLDFPSRGRGIIEAGIILFWSVGSVFVLFHLVQFAQLAA